MQFSGYVVNKVILPNACRKRGMNLRNEQGTLSEIDYLYTSYTRHVKYHGFPDLSQISLRNCTKLRIGKRVVTLKKRAFIRKNVNISGVNRNTY